MAPASSSSAMVRAKKALSMAASVAASAMVARTFINEFLPSQMRDYIDTSLTSLLSFLISPSNSNDLTIVIEELEGYASNEIYEAATSYVGGKVSPSTKRLRVVKQESDNNMLVTVDRDQEVTDVFDGIEYRWRLTSRQSPPRHSGDEGQETRFFELTFHRRYQEKTLEAYLPHVVEKWRAIKDSERQINLFLLRFESWSPVKLDHPATFDTLAMEPELKMQVKGDLERFVRRRDYYRRVGKAWKRGYLLYGPPGTGKSSLIAAMANFLKFDVYDLELTEVSDNSALRAVLMGTSNRSILVVEDIDCSIQLRPRSPDDDGKEATETNPPMFKEGVTLSGVLNMIDGLMSSCGDERIIVLTTNHRERLDPALLRPGRMDLHVHMSYCTPAGFRTLAENYHGVNDHKLFPEIERLIGEVVDVTPAEVTGELMKSEEPDEALELLLQFAREKTKDPNRRKGRAETEEPAVAEEEEEGRKTEHADDKLEERNNSSTIENGVSPKEELSNGQLNAQREETEPADHKSEENESSSTMENGAVRKEKLSNGQLHPPREETPVEQEAPYMGNGVINCH